MGLALLLSWRRLLLAVDDVESGRWMEATQKSEKQWENLFSIFPSIHSPSLCAFLSVWKLDTSWLLSFKFSSFLANFRVVECSPISFSFSMFVDSPFCRQGNISPSIFHASVCEVSKSSITECFSINLWQQEGRERGKVKCEKWLWNRVVFLTRQPSKPLRLRLLWVEFSVFFGELEEI